MSKGAQIQDVSHRYVDDVWALRDVTITLSSGVTALVGVNGAGKSTLLSALSGGLRPTTGRVLVDGADIYGRGRAAALRRTALMPQSLTMPDTLTALEVVSVIGWMRGLPAREVRSRSQVALQAVGLEDRATSRVKALSGGMKRRVALAQAIVASPDVLLLDEPSTGLDPQQRRRMVDIVRTLSGAVLFSSHVMEDVVDTANRVIVLHNGTVVFDGETHRLEQLAPATASTHRAEAAFLRLIAQSEAISR